MKSGPKLALSKELALAERRSLVEAEPIPREADGGHRVRCAGKEATSFCHWDVLGVYAHPERIKALHRAVSAERLSSGAPRRYATFDEHLRAEKRVAEFFGAEAAILFPSKNQSVLSVITAFAGAGAAVLCDPWVSAPVADACSLVSAEFVDWDGKALDAALEKLSGANRVIVYLESVSPHTGIVRDIEADLALCERYGAWGIVDESAAIGLLGLRGAGSADGVLPSPALLARIAGFNLVPGVDLGAVAGSVELREILWRKSRYLRSEQAPSRFLAEELTASLDLVEGAIGTRLRLKERAKAVRSTLVGQGWTTLGAADFPIVCVGIERAEGAERFCEAMLERGVLLESFSLRPGLGFTSVARVLLSVQHSEAEVATLFEGFGELKKRIGALQIRQ